jgi:acyl carrier protein
MDASLQERVLAFVFEQTGVKREKIHLETTLSGDLGVEGDDAVEFFEEFRTEFAVELQELGRDWSLYFGPEGPPLSASIIIIIPTVLIGLALTKISPRVPEWLSFITAFVSWMFLLVLWGNWRERNAKIRRPRVSVQDLVDCAHSGAWTKAVPADAIKKFGQFRPYGGLGSWFTR